MHILHFLSLCSHRLNKIIFSIRIRVRRFSFAILKLLNLFNKLLIFNSEQVNFLNKFFFLHILRWLLGLVHDLLLLLYSLSSILSTSILLCSLKKSLIGRNYIKDKSDWNSTSNIDHWSLIIRSNLSRHIEVFRAKYWSLLLVNMLDRFETARLLLPRGSIFLASELWDSFEILFHAFCFTTNQRILLSCACLLASPLPFNRNLFIHLFCCYYWKNLNSDP